MDKTQKGWEASEEEWYVGEFTIDGKTYGVGFRYSDKFLRVRRLTRGLSGLKEAEVRLKLCSRRSE